MLQAVIPPLCRIGCWFGDEQRRDNYAGRGHQHAIEFVAGIRKVFERFKCRHQSHTFVIVFKTPRDKIRAISVRPQGVDSVVAKEADKNSVAARIIQYLGVDSAEDEKCGYYYFRVGDIPRHYSGVSRGNGRCVRLVKPVGLFGLYIFTGGALEIANRVAKKISGTQEIRGFTTDAADDGVTLHY